MVLIRNKPLATDILSDSQVDLFNNNNAIDDSFGSDHYAASDLTADNGKHRVITTPVQVVHPPTPLDCRFYSMEDHVTIGALQYTRKVVDQVPTPLTCLQSSSFGITLVPAGVSNILDFTGVPYCFGSVKFCSVVMGPLTPLITESAFFWNGSLGITSTVTPFIPSNAFIEFSGAVLRVRNIGGLTLIQGSWTLRFDRIFTPL